MCRRWHKRPRSNIKEADMKKLAMVIALFTLLTTVAISAAANDDTDFRAGLKSYNSRNFSDAVKHFKEYINKKPDPTAYYLTGYALYKLGKFSEADDYFRDAYLIDPEFSLEKVGLIRKASGEVVKKKPADVKKSEPVGERKETAPVFSDESSPGRTVKQPDTKAMKPVQTAPAEEQKSKASGSSPAAPIPEAPIQSAPQKPELQAPPQAVPAPVAPAAPVVPPMPMPKQMSDAAGPAALVAIIAAFGMVLVFIAIAVYVYFSLCLFFIAKKLGVPAAWTAWIPIVQTWTFVVSAGKPGWWVLLFLVPIVNLFLGIYLWMCITENLGKNKWLGLLILVPLVGFIYPAWLAFSRTEGSGG